MCESYPQAGARPDMRAEGAKVGARPDMRELPKIQLRDRICAHHRSTSVAALIVMATPSDRAGGDRIDEHVSLREEARTVCQIGGGTTSFWGLTYERLHFTAHCGYDGHLHKVMVLIDLV